MRGHDEIAHRAPLARGIGLGIGLVTRGDFRLGRGGIKAELIGAEHRKAQHPAFGAHEARAVILVPGFELLRARRLGGGKGRRRDQRDLALPPLQHQRGIVARDLLGHARRAQRSFEQLLFQQAIAQIAPQGCIADAALAQRCLIDILIEFAGRTAEGRDLEDFAVNQIAPGAQAIVLRIAADGIAIDQLLDDFLKPVLLDELRHGDGGIELGAHLFEPGLGAARHFGSRDRLLADKRNPAVGRNPAEGRPGDIRGGKGKGDQRQKADEQRQAEPGLEEAAKQRKHRSGDPSVARGIPGASRARQRA